MSTPPADLRVYWSKREKALVYHGEKTTGGVLAMFIEHVKMIDAYDQRHGLAAQLHRPDPSDERSLAQELDARGFDLATLRLSIRRKTTP